METDKVLIMMVGLPRSGKSTQAKGLSKTFNAPIVEPDSIRLALHGQRFCPSAEDFIWATAKLMVRSLFGSGHNFVILDATNLTKHRRSDWRSKEWKRAYKIVDCPPDICKERAVETGQEDLIPVIDRMYKSYQIVEAYEAEISMLHLHRLHGQVGTDASK